MVKKAASTLAASSCQSPCGVRKVRKSAGYVYAFGLMIAIERIHRGPRLQRKAMYANGRGVAIWRMSHHMYGKEQKSATV